MRLALVATLVAIAGCIAAVGAWAAAPGPPKAVSTSCTPPPAPPHSGNQIAFVTYHCG